MQFNSLYELIQLYNSVINVCHSWYVNFCLLYSSYRVIFYNNLNRFLELQRFVGSQFIECDLK